MCVCFLLSIIGSLLSYYLCREKKKHEESCCSILWCCLCRKYKGTYDHPSVGNGKPSGDIDLQEHNSGNVKEDTATDSNGVSENGHSTAQEMTQPGTFKVCGF